MVSNELLKWSWLSRIERVHVSLSLQLWVLVAMISGNARIASQSSTRRVHEIEWILEHCLYQGADLDGLLTGLLSTETSL